MEDEKRKRERERFEQKLRSIILDENLNLV